MRVKSFTMSQIEEMERAVEAHTGHSMHSVATLMHKAGSLKTKSNGACRILMKNPEKQWQLCCIVSQLMVYKALLDTSRELPNQTYVLGRYW